MKKKVLALIMAGTKALSMAACGKCRNPSNYYYDGCFHGSMWKHTEPGYTKGA